MEEIKKELLHEIKQKEKLENENIKLNDNIERLNVNIQEQQKHHDEEIQTMKDRIEFYKEKR